MNKLFVLIALFALAACGGEKKPATVTPATAAKPKMQLAPVTRGNLSAVQTIPGQLRAWQEVSIFPKVNGYVKQVYVDIGSHVRAGQLLMLLEAPEMSEAVVQSREKYEHARSNYMLSKEKYARLLEASQTAGAVSPLDLAATRSSMHADSSVANAERANWNGQQTMQGYLRVTAPFDGVITQRTVHPGALVSAAAHDVPMLELKEISRLRLQIQVPEASVGFIHAGDDVDFALSAFPGESFHGRLSRISQNMDPRYRSEDVEIDVPNPSGRLSAGMYADVHFRVQASPNAWVVPATAVVTSTERKYVVVARGGVTVKVDVRTGLASGGRVEVFGSLQEGDRVVVNASDETPEGVQVD